MAILITHSGGSEWNAQRYDELLERIIPDPSNPPDGMIAHYGGPAQNGGWKVTDVWESEAHWERFRDETLIPAAQELQSPPFDSDIGALHNKIVSEAVTA